jgi:peptidoglycan/LPS O-acetylase OafA/YrhL
MITRVAAQSVRLAGSGASAILERVAAHVTAPRPTVQDVMRSHAGVAPGFGLMRHALAVIIILYHGYNITFGRDVNPGYAKGELFLNWGDLSATQFTIEVLRPGLFALVGAFFALSGFLVAGSALRTKSVRVFLSFRVLRIVPALMTEVALSALVLGPIVTVQPLAQYFWGAEFYQYFGNILGFVRYTLPGVFVHNPRANFVNANLWTLPAEFYCYLVLAVLMGVGLFFQRRLYNRAFALATLLLLLLPLFWGLSSRADNTHYAVYYIVYLFFVGALFYLYSGSIPVRRDLFWASFVGYYVLTLIGGFDVLAGFLLVYAVVYLGVREFPRFDKAMRGNDYSYGMYLYGYPISQTVIFFLQPLFFWWPGALRLGTVMLLSVLCTLVFAVLSWHVIERPALGLKRILIGPSRSSEVAAKPALEAREK